MNDKLTPEQCAIRNHASRTWSDVFSDGPVNQETYDKMHAETLKSIEAADAIAIQQRRTRGRERAEAEQSEKYGRSDSAATVIFIIVFPLSSHPFK
jgi:hypothetical protein